MLPIEVIAYAAGLFDGEGCVYIGRVNRAGRRLPCYRMYCKISMTDPAPLMFMQRYWPGHMGINHATKKPQNKDVYNWCLPSKKSAVFLRDVLPYLIVKRERALLGLEFQDHMSSSGKYRLGMYSKELKGQEILPPEVIALRETYYQRMRTLNKRGVNVQV